MISEDRHRVLQPRQVLVVDSFVRVSTCNRILEELEQSYWSMSAVSRFRSGQEYTEVQEHFRASSSAQQAWFGRELRQIIKRIEKRLSAEFECDPICLEEWQATRYKRGGRFNYHIDGGYWKESTAGDRKRTYMLYLDAPEKGGETHFRALNITVAPKPGRLVVWDNLLPTGLSDYAMIHSGLQVKKGRKTTLVTWERERSIRQVTR
jgi:prolyl 4-hydroxylase